MSAQSENRSSPLEVIHACWEAGCSVPQIASITFALSGTHLSAAAIADHINEFNSEAKQP